MMKAALIVLIGLILFIAGTLNHQSTVLDGAFGAAYYLFDRLTWWRPGPSWVTENRMMATFCFFVFPIFVSLALSSIAVFGSSNQFRRSKATGMLFVALFCVTVLLQSSPGSRISYFAYWTANY